MVGSAVLKGECNLSAYIVSGSRKNKHNNKCENINFVHDFIKLHSVRIDVFVRVL